MNNRIFGILALTLFACATVKETSSGDKAAGAAAPRDDCPPGYGLLTDDRGTACWKGGDHGPPWTVDELPPPHCKPFRCPQSGYLLWNCSAKADDEAPGYVCPPADSRGTVQLGAEGKTRLQNKLQICRKSADLAHHAAETQTLEDLRATHGADPLYSECLDTFRELARLEPDAYSQPPEIVECLDELWGSFANNTVTLRTAACQYRIGGALQSETDVSAALSRYEELRPVHNTCVNAFGLKEYENLFRSPEAARHRFCTEVEKTLACQK